MAESLLATALGLRGDNPEKLDLIKINAEQVQRDTIAGNLQNAPQAMRLADLSNTFSTEQLLKTLETMLPGFGQMRDQITGVLSSKLHGEIPRDVRNMLQRNAAERGVAMGTSGSQFNEFDELRNLGLTSLHVQNEGLAQASSWIRSMPRAPTFDFTTMFFTPQQRLSFEFQQAQANKPIEWLNNQIDALPSNMERAAAGFLDWVATTGLNVASMYTGGLIASGDSGREAAASAANAHQVGSANQMGPYGEAYGSGRSGMQNQEQSGDAAAMGGIMSMFKGMGSGGFI